MQRLEHLQGSHYNPASRSCHTVRANESFPLPQHEGQGIRRKVGRSAGECQLRTLTLRDRYRPGRELRRQDQRRVRAIEPSASRVVARRGLGIAIFARLISI